METVETLISFVEEWRWRNSIVGDLPLNESQITQLAQELTLKVNQLHVGPPNAAATLMLYSSGYGNVGAWQVVGQLVAESNGQLYAGNNTEGGRLLNSDQFRQALTRAVGSEALGDALLDGRKVGGVRTQYGVGNVLAFNDLVSLRLAESASGNVKFVGPQIATDSVFALTEFKALLANPNVTHINGVDKRVFTEIGRVFPALEAEKAMHSLVRAAGLIEAGTQEFTLNGERQSVLRMTEAWHGAKYFRAVLREAAVTLTHSTIRALGFVGVVANFVTLLSATAEASQKAQDGDYDGAALVMGEWSARFGGSMAAGAGATYVAGVALAPLLLAGPLGAAGWAIGTTLAGLAGGIFGDQVVEALFQPFDTDETWNLTSTVQLALRDDAVGLAYRSALKELNPISLLMGTPPNAAELELFDPATGEGFITREWIEARCVMMAAFAEYYGRDAEYDQLLSKPFALPFGFHGDVVMSDASKGADGNLTIDGFDFGITEPRYIRFADDNGNDLNGGERDDKLFGGAGNDRLEGGKDGNSSAYDYLEGGLGDDRYIYVSGDGQDVIRDVEGDDRIIVNGEALSGDFARYTNPAKPGFLSWSNDESGTLIFTLLDGDLANGTLEITGPGLGDAGSITIKNYVNSQFGFELEQANGVTEITGPNLIPEGGKRALHVQLAGGAVRGDRIRLSVGPEMVGQLVLIVDGVQHAFNGNGSFDLDLDLGKSAYDFTLFSFTDVSASMPFTFSATLLDDDGQPIEGSGISQSMSVVAGGDNTATQLDVEGLYTDVWAMHNVDGSRFTGTFRNELILGSIADEFIDGGDGSDFILGGYGGDTLLGGNGNDYIRGSHRAAYSPGHNSDFAGVFNMLIPGNGWGVLDLGGGSYWPLHWAYTATGWGAIAGDSGNYIDGGAGNDDIEAGSGADTAYGGTGDDRIRGGGASDTLFGDDGWDIIYGDGFDLGDSEIEVTALFAQGADTIYGGAGGDWLYGQGLGDTIYGGTGNDQIYGDSAETGVGNDFLDGEDGDDIVVGGAGNDILIGGAGNDQMVGDGGGGSPANDGNDSLSGGEGDDILAGYGGDDHLSGGDGADSLLGDGAPTPGSGPDEDFLEGGAGNDVLIGGRGADVLAGESGDDYLEGDASGLAPALAGNDALDGGDGDDTLSGGGGDDQLVGGAGVDLLFGGNGNDYLQGDAGNDQLSGEDGNDALLGGAGNDLLDGGDGDDMLDGGEGSDQLNGGAGNDTLISDGNNELLRGGAGNDTYLVDANGSYVIVDNQGTNNIILTGIRPAAISSSLSGGQVLLQSEGDSFLGIDGDSFQTFTAISFQSGGSWSAEDVRQAFTPGTSGTHDINLKAGVSLGSIQYYAKGDDLILLYSGAVSDWVDTSQLFLNRVMWSRTSSESLGLPPGGQALVLTNWYHATSSQYVNRLLDTNQQSLDFTTLANNAPGLVFGSDGGDELIGSSAADDLRGGSGDDKLNGNGGNDTLNGGTGSDDLNGGDGNDTYLFNAGDGADTLIDGSGIDVLRLGAGINRADVTLTGVGSTIKVQLGAGGSDRVDILYANQLSGNAVERIEFADGFVWDATDIQARLTGDRKPVVAATLGNQSIQEGAPFSITIPAGTFTDPNGGALTYSATLADGTALPAGMSFDPVTRILSGNVPVVVTNIAIRATDASGLFDSTTFTITPTPSNIAGTSGDDIINGTAYSDIINALGGNDVVHGGAGNDRIAGDLGNDILHGGAGNDTFNFSIGDGIDEIRFDEDASGDVNTLQMGGGITRGSLKFTADNTGTVTVQLLGAGQQPLSNSTILLKDFLAIENLDRRLSQITFSNGATPIIAAEIDQMVMSASSGDNYLRGGSAPDIIDGGAGDDSIYGMGGNDTLTGGTGNDVIGGGTGNDDLRGGVGDDEYRISLGDGADVITDESGNDAVKFGAGIAVGDLAVSESAAGLSVVIGPAANGNSLLIKNWAAGGENSIDRFVFSNGTTLDRAGIDQLNIGNHSPRVAQPVARQFAQVDLPFSFVLGTGVFSDAENGSLTIAATLAAGSALPSWLNFDPVTRTFSGTPAGANSGMLDLIVRATDAGGLSTSMPLQIDVRTLINGTSSNDFITVSDGVGAVVYGLDGADYLYGGDGSDDLFGGNGNDNLIGWEGDDVLDGGAGNDTLTGVYGNDLLIGGPGNDNLEVLQDLGETRMRFSLGDGTDTVDFYNFESRDSFEFGAGISRDYVLSNVRFSTDGELLIAYNPSSATDVIKLDGHWNFYYPEWDIRTIGSAVRFADGSSTTLTELYVAANRITSGDDVYFADGTGSVDVGAGNDTVYQVDYSNPTVHGGAGNDVVYGYTDGTFLGEAGDDFLQGWYDSALDGGTGNDRFEMYSGLAADPEGNEFYDLRSSLNTGGPFAATTIVDNGGWDVVAIEDGLQWFTFTRQGDDLVGTSYFNWQTTVQGWFASSANQIELFQFDNNDVSGNYVGKYSAAQIEALATGVNMAPIVSQSIADTGVSFGSFLELSLTAANFSDTRESRFDLSYTVTLANGNALPQWLAWNAEDLEFTGTADSTDAGIYTVRVTATDSGGLSVSDEFNVIVASNAQKGTNNNNFFNGTSSADNYFGMGGGDTINGNNGNDQLYGGIGNDTISGGAGDDTISGGVDNDTLTGGTGNNIFRFDKGDGFDTHTLESATTQRFQFGPGVTLADTRVELGRATNGSLFVQLSYNSEDPRGDIVQLNNVYTLSGGTYSLNANASVYSFEFPDGTTRTLAQLLATSVATSGDDVLVLSAAGSLNGGDGNDLLLGSSGVDQLNGGNGNDQLVGGAGNDTLTGGAGDDTYDVDSVSDLVAESSAAGNDTVNISAATGFTGGVVNLSSFANVENLSIGAGFGAATLNGTAIANAITGNANANRIVGGLGDDILTGGGGSDTFAGFALDTGNDVIAQIAGASDVNVLEYATGESIAIGQLQLSHVGADLVLQASANSSVRVQNFYGAANAPVSRVTLTTAGLQYTYSAAQVAAAGNGTNGGPAVNAAIADTNATVGSTFSYQLTANTFADIESQNTLAYTAALSGGGALPSWLTFDAATRRFTGTPTGTSTQLTVRVTATDGGGLATSDDFVINVQGGVIAGTEGNDTLVGTSSNDIMQGLGGDDTLNGAAGADQMSGGSGNDTYVVDNTGDQALENASEGTDLVQSSVTFTLDNNVENLTLTNSGSTTVTGTGNSQNNVLMGSSGSNTLAGGGGNDTLDPGSAGTDILQGQTGDDTYIVTRSSGVTLTEASNEGTDTVLSSITFTLATNFENLTLTNTGSTVVTGTGNSADNVLTGSSGSNTLVGGNGNDTLDPGSAGTDILQGQAGDDIYIVNRTSGITVTESSGAGTDTVQASVTYTLAANVENLVLTGTAAGGTGNTANNTVTGNASANTLNGGTAGTDTLIGGAGDDTYVVDHTGVTVTELAGEGTDVVQSTVSFTLGGNVENLTLTNTGTTVITGTGNGDNNILTGSSGSNTLVGGNGNDTLDPGSAGTDSLQGQAGDDTYIVNRSSGITLTEASSQGIDTVQSSVTFTLATNFENLTLTNTGTTVVTGTGNSADNVLVGGSGSNTLDGGSGNDTLRGAGGTDTLTGGLGADIYQYAIGDGNDTINNVASDSLTDRLQMTGIVSSQATFAHTGNNLVITIAGTSTITVSNWFSATANRIDFVNFTNREVTAAEIDALANGGGGSFARSLSAKTESVSGEQSRSASIPHARYFRDIRDVAFEDSIDSTALLNELIGNASMGASTLADKLVAKSNETPRLRPIKSFLDERTTIGIDRLIDAMSTFGMDSVADANSRSSEAFDRGDLGQLTVGTEMIRHTQPFRSEARALIE